MEARQQAEKIIAEIKNEIEVINSSTVGWTKVDLPNGYRDRYHAVDVELWCDANCGEFKKYGRTFWFREDKDASMFLLKWS